MEAKAGGARASLAVGILFLVGCALPLKAYKLNDGTVVECRQMSEEPCGVWLGDCSDGLERFCQHDVSEVRGEKGSIRWQI